MAEVYRTRYLRVALLMVGMLAPTGHHDANHSPLAETATPASTPSSTREV